MSELNSVIASIPLFFNEKEGIDYDALQKYVGIVAGERHTQLLYLMAYNSRINLLSFDEVVELNKFLQEIAKDIDIKYTLCTPYKAANSEVFKFLEKFDTDELLYGVSMLFPERMYDDFDVVTDYFSIPAEFGMKTLMHEMKFVSGKDGSLTDWDIGKLIEIQHACPIIGLKEDSKNDALTSECLQQLDVDLILAGGGVTQAANFLEYNPKAWLAGVSLIRPDLAKWEHGAVLQKKKDSIDLFCSSIEMPFFDLCKNFGWHCIHKFLLGHVYGFSINERRPMAKLDSQAIEVVSETWDTIINPAIEQFIEKVE